MNHYVVTRTTTWRFEAKDWEAATKAVFNYDIEGSDSNQLEMVEEETGKEETLNG